LAIHRRLYHYWREPLTADGRGKPIAAGFIAALRANGGERGELDVPSQGEGRRKE
jgi:hypothetical protein